MYSNHVLPLILAICLSICHRTDSLQVLFYLCLCNRKSFKCLFLCLALSGYIAQRTAININGANIGLQNDFSFSCCVFLFFFFESSNILFLSKLICDLYTFPTSGRVANCVFKIAYKGTYINTAAQFSLKTQIYCCKTHQKENFNEMVCIFSAVGSMYCYTSNKVLFTRETLIKTYLINNHCRF